jgi:hypothetical protein
MDLILKRENFLVSLFFLIFFLFVASPVSDLVLLYSPQDLLKVLLANVVIGTVFIIAPLLVIIFGIYLVLRKQITLSEISCAILFLLSIFIIFNAYLFPLGKITFDGRSILGNIPNIKWEFSDLLFIFIVLVILRMRLYRFSIFLTIPLIFIILNSAYDLRFYNKSSVENANKTITLGKKNAILMVFDGIDSNIISDISKARPDFYSDTFDGFTHYINAISIHPGTWASLGEVLGGEEFNIVNINKSGKKPENMAYQVAPMSFLDKMNHYDWSGSYTNATFSGGELSQPAINVNMLSVYKLLPNFLRVHLIKSNFWNLYPQFIELVLGPNVAFPIYGEASSPEIIKNFGTKYIVDMSIENKLNLIYFSIPHPPYGFDSQCNYAAKNNPRNQHECVIGIISILVRKLKENKLFDKSVIVVTSDHGWYGPEDQELLPSYQNRFSKGMLKTALFIKPLYTESGDILLNESITYTQDATKYLCRNISCPKEFKRPIRDVSNVYISSSDPTAWNTSPFRIEQIFNYHGGEIFKPSSWSQIFPN